MTDPGAIHDCWMELIDEVKKLDEGLSGKRREKN